MFNPQFMEQMRQNITPDQLKQQADMINNMSPQQLEFMRQQMQSMGVDTSYMTPEMMKTAANQMKNMNDQDFQKIKTQPIPPNLGQRFTPTNQNYQQSQPQQTSQPSPQNSALFQKVNDLKNQGNQQFQEQKFEKAIVFYKRGINTLEENGSLEQALIDLENTLRNNLAICYSKTQEYDQAIEQCKKVLTFGDNFKAFYWMGICYLNKNMHQMSIQYLEKAQKMNSQDQKVKEQLTIAKQKLQESGIEEIDLEPLKDPQESQPSGEKKKKKKNKKNKNKKQNQEEQEQEQQTQSTSEQQNQQGNKEIQSTSQQNLVEEKVEIKEDKESSKIQDKPKRNFEFKDPLEQEQEASNQKKSQQKKKVNADPDAPIISEPIYPKESKKQSQSQQSKIQQSQPQQNQPSSNQQFNQQQIPPNFSQSQQIFENMSDTQMNDMANQIKNTDSTFMQQILKAQGFDIDIQQIEQMKNMMSPDTMKYMSNQMKSNPASFQQPGQQTQQAQQIQQKPQQTPQAQNPMLNPLLGNLQNNPMFGNLQSNPMFAQAMQNPQMMQQAMGMMNTMMKWYGRANKFYQFVKSYGIFIFGVLIAVIYFNYFA